MNEQLKTGLILVLTCYSVFKIGRWGIQIYYEKPLGETSNLSMIASDSCWQKRHYKPCSLLSRERIVLRSIPSIICSFKDTKSILSSCHGCCTWYEVPFFSKSSIWICVIIGYGCIFIKERCCKFHFTNILPRSISTANVPGKISG